MERKYQITRRQLFTLAFVGLLSPMIRLLPKAAVEQAGSAAWLSPLAAVPGIVFLTWIASLMVKDSAPGEGLGEVFQRYLGRIAGKILAGLFGLWICLYAGFILRAGAERLLSTAYESGDKSFFILTVMAVVLLTVRGRLRALARAGALFFFLLLGTVFGVLIFALPQLRVENLLPVYGRDTGRIFLGGIPAADVLSPWVYLLFLYGYVQRREARRSLLKDSLRWQGLELLVVLLLMVTTIGCFGEGFLMKLQSPFFTMIRDIRIFNIVERIESVVIAIWVITDYIFISGLLCAGTEALRGSLGLEKKTVLVYVGAAVALAFSFLAARSSFTFSGVSQRLIPLVNLIFLYGILPLICLIGKIRKKSKKGD